MTFIPHMQTCTNVHDYDTHTHTHMCTHTLQQIAMSVSYNVKELYSGVLNKCGAKVKSWNRRWFVLKSDYCLYYYKDTAKGHLGAISLRDPKFSARKGSVGDISWPKGVATECTIAVVTTHRTYFMYGSGEQEADDWVRILNSSREKLLEEANSANRLLSGSRSYSATTVSNNPSNNDSPDISKQRLSEAIPPMLPEDGPELTYEAVYDSPEADLSQSGSCNGSPNLDTKQGERHTSTTDSIYDLASGEEQVGGRHDHGEAIDNSQPLYAEAAEPDEQGGEEDEPSAVYDDVETTHHSGHTLQRQANGSGAGGGKDEPMEMYESIDAESPHTPSAKHLPLPAIPMAARNANSANGGSQPIYEDIPDTSGTQPLYEAVMVDDSPTHEMYVQEAERSDDERSGSLPPLPPKDDLPPLPPKDNSAPQLPPKGGQSSPVLPAKKTEVKVPPLPPKEDSPASSHGNTTKHVPPSLPAKDEPSEDINHQAPPPPVSPRHGHPTSSSSPSSGGPVAQQQASTGSSKLSPSGQRKPIPSERTLTPPMTKKPSPIPRRRVLPTTGVQGSAAADGSPVTGKASPTTGGPRPVDNSPVFGDTTRTARAVNGAATMEEASSKTRSTSSTTGRRTSQDSLPSGECVHQLQCILQYSTVMCACPR